MKKIITSLLAAAVLAGCATGSTPEAKKANARKDTQEALQTIYSEHPGSRAAVQKSLAYLVCTGSDTYLFAASSGGGVCTYHKGGKITYYRFATLGAGLGIGLKKVAFVYAFNNRNAMKRFEDSGWDAGAKADATAKANDQGDQASANTSFDADGVKVYQSAIWGAAAQATVQGYKFWKTDFTDDFMSNPE